jgi:hypothetical protein
MSNYASSKLYEKWSVNYRASFQKHYDIEGEAPINRPRDAGEDILITLPLSEWGIKIKKPTKLTTASSFQLHGWLSYLHQAY